MKKITGCVILFLLLMSTVWVIADSSKTLTMPSFLKVIEREAFYGIAVDKVVIPEGTTEIRSRAFANSDLTDVILPSSLKYIADDAFEGCSESLTVFAGDDTGTYAYEWADAKGYIRGPVKAVVIELPNTVKHIDILETYQIPYHTVPRNTTEKLQWKSLDPEIGTVDQNGLVTPLKAGYINIQALDSEGRYLASVTLEVTGDFYQSSGLEYALTTDGTGYRVTGYAGDPERITIPATYKGLPVVGFEPGAFKNCTKLTDISLEAGHSVLYMENAALYANLPKKTLLCYPGRHILNRHYYVSADTQSIAAYAFSHCYLRDLTIPEGVTSIGDCAFYTLQNQLFIYLPDSLTDFGSHLFQDQQWNAAFYVKSITSPGCTYAYLNNIPYAVIDQRTPEPTMVPTPTPVPTSTPAIPPLDEGNIVVYDQLQWPNYVVCEIKCLYDISSYEGDDVTEVRLAIQDQWKDLVYYPEMAQQTGLYGAGYTEQKATLRAYDKYGNQIGAIEINGNFTFSFDGACTLGVAGGKGTKMMVVPTKPIFITSPGRYPLQLSQWHDFIGGDIYQHYIIAMPSGSMHYDFPENLNILAYQTLYCTTATWPDEEGVTRPEYIFCTFYTQDSSRVSQMNQFTFIFDKLSCVFNSDALFVYASSLPEKSDDLGDRINQVFDATRTEMLSGHYPASPSIPPVYVYIDGTYPSATASVVWLDSQFFMFDENDVSAIAHEFVHAIDRSNWGRHSSYAPSPWLEGRAEYISKVICSKLGVPYTSLDYGHGKEYDWSFLSADDRADFFRYYHDSTNVSTQYSVGYHFYAFLIDTYGSDVGEKIMNNIATLPNDGSDKAGFFKRCVETATEEGVFQRFINDVVIPSGT